MNYSLNEYLQYIVTDSTCVEVYSDNDMAAKLLAQHKNNNDYILSLSECISDNTYLLPTPSELIIEIDEKIHALNRRVVVIGIDGYLLLVSRQSRNAFMVALQLRIDEQKLNAAYMISKSNFDKKQFSNPKYENSLQIVNITENGKPVLPPTVRLVSQKWVENKSYCRNWIELLDMLGNFESGDNFEHIDITLALSDFTLSQAGLSEGIVQYTDVKRIAEHFYEIKADLPQSTIESLLIKSKSAKLHPKLFLKKQFGEININSIFALKRLKEMPNDDLWIAYVWMLKNEIDNTSYMSKVLSENLNCDNILRVYISDYPLMVFGDINSIKYAKERADAIKELNGQGESFIVEFIENANSYTNDVVACWLNCGTKAEKQEIVRRVSMSDLTTGLSCLWQGLYPMLDDYLSMEYDFGIKELNDYFDDYRKFKLKNTVTEDFVKSAGDFLLPPLIQKRDVLLSEMPTDEKSAILVVDGMGVEYIPAIFAVASRREINIKSIHIAEANLPTETDFNKIGDKTIKINRLPPAKLIDDIVHDGAVKHEHCTPEQNIVAVFDALEGVLIRVVKALMQYDRVILTADHGASRLAIIAYENDLAKINEEIKNPLDWRYARASKGMVCPDGFEEKRDLERQCVYWIIRGYNRLSKQGAPKNELHGGASLEERLVPIIVFSKVFTDTIIKKRSKPSEQLIEEVEFSF
ncbi:MAG: BREX-4 system phosphatase PglZ [Clostridiales bacterium]|jgi:hypothetical protein|nr:BREX-4 system phosphatase PglZ [Clostridiales bacterium]